MSLIAIPITLGNIVLMDLLLAVFGKGYVNAYLAGIILSITSLIGSIAIVSSAPPRTLRLRKLTMKRFGYGEKI